MQDGASFKRILVAFDGSSDSVKAVKIAASIAKEHGSKLTIVHVYTVPTYSYMTPAGLSSSQFSALDDAAKTHARDILRRGIASAGSAGVKAGGEMLQGGSVVECIVDFAANEKADLIVMGTRGVTGFKRMLVGSVSSGVVAHAKCPVLVVR
jgi:nucleotide-binding universal stress UspA family protein